MENKKLIIVMLASTIVLYAITTYIWGTCPQTNCPVSLIDNYLSTFKSASLFLGIYFLIFLFLPMHYFEAWLKKIFSWAFPLSAFVVIATQGGGSVMSFSKTETVIICGAFFGVVSLLFLLYHKVKTHNAALSGK